MTQYPCFTARRRSWFLWSRSPLGPGGLMKSDPSFIKNRGWSLIIKRRKKKKGKENKSSLTRSHLRSTGRPEARDRRAGHEVEVVSVASRFSHFYSTAIQPLEKINWWNRSWLTAHPMWLPAKQIWFPTCLLCIYTYTWLMNVSASGGSFYLHMSL